MLKKDKLADGTLKKKKVCWALGCSVKGCNQNVERDRFHARSVPPSLSSQNPFIPNTNESFSRSQSIKQFSTKNPFASWSDDKLNKNDRSFTVSKDMPTIRFPKLGSQDYFNPLNPFIQIDLPESGESPQTETKSHHSTDSISPSHPHYTISYDAIPVKSQPSNTESTKSTKKSTNQIFISNFIYPMNQFPPLNIPPPTIPMQTSNQNPYHQINHFQIAPNGNVLPIPYQSSLPKQQQQQQTPFNQPTSFTPNQTAQDYNFMMNQANQFNPFYFLPSSNQSTPHATLSKKTAKFDLSQNNYYTPSTFSSQDQNTKTNNFIPINPNNRTSPIPNNFMMNQNNTNNNHNFYPYLNYNQYNAYNKYQHQQQQQQQLNPYYQLPYFQQNLSNQYLNQNVMNQQQIKSNLKYRNQTSPVISNSSKQHQQQYPQVSPYKNLLDNAENKNYKHAMFNNQPGGAYISANQIMANIAGNNEMKNCPHYEHMYRFMQEKYTNCLRNGY